MHSDTLAIDFGTSNTAAAVLRDGRVHRIAVERDADTLPTAVFFPSGGGPMRIGADAGRALTAGEEGRYMRALKSVLGTPLLHESRMIGGRRRTLSDVIAAFLAELRTRCETITGQPFRRALSGRPVHFHPDPDRDARAEDDLRACYHAAGFTHVSFLAEPEAAALACQHAGTQGAPDTGTGLIVDIGGGTSDFTVFRSGPRGPQILASHGLRLGGTDFDRAVSLAHAMPALGLGGTLAREMGTGTLPVPQGLYVDLATWAKIPFLYTPETRRTVAGMARLATDPAPLARLHTVLRDELGHDLAFAAEAAKIAANALPTPSSGPRPSPSSGSGPSPTPSPDATLSPNSDLGQLTSTSPDPSSGPTPNPTGTPSARIDLAFLEPDLAPAITRDTLDAALAPFRAELREAMAHTLQRADTAPAAITRIVLVGGSSLMALVGQEATTLCPTARLLKAEAFTAVVDGLALATRPAKPGPTKPAAPA